MDKVPGQCCPGKPAVKRLRIGGQEVGIAGYEEMMERVLEHVHESDDEQREALLSELRACNYVPPSSEKEYLGALWSEFRQLRAKKLGQVEEQYRGIPREEIPWFPTIDRERCTNCGVCVDFCKRGVYTTSKFPMVTNPYRCIVSCTGCKDRCDAGAISFPSLVELRETMKQLRKKYGILTD